MKAVVYHEFGGPIAIEEVADPAPAVDGAVLRVEATGLCRSDWHGWRGHDPGIVLPHGLAAHDYPALLELVRSGVVRPDALVSREIGLADASAALVELDHGSPTGMTVIHPWTTRSAPARTSTSSPLGDDETR